MMIRHPAIPFLATLAAAAALLQPSAARADDTQFWLNAGISDQISDDTTLQLGLEQHRQDGPDENIVEMAADRKVGHGLTLGGGFEMHDTGGLTELRPLQQVGYAIGPFSMRSRIEERFFDHADRVGLRLRQLVQFSPKLTERLGGVVSTELFYQLQSSDTGGPHRIDQMRFTAGVNYKPAPRLNLFAGYLFILRPRDGEDGHTHVPRLGLSYRF